MSTTNRLIEHSKELLAGLDWPTYARPVTDETIGLAGYFFKNTPPEFRDLWLGSVEDSPIREARGKQEGRKRKEGWEE